MELKYKTLTFEDLPAGECFYLNDTKYRKIQEVVTGEYEDDNVETFNCIDMEIVALDFVDDKTEITTEKSPNGLLLDTDDMIMLKDLLNSTERTISTDEEMFKIKLLGILEGEK